MTTYYITPDTPKELAEYIDSLDNVKSIQTTLNQYLKFKKNYKLGFRHNLPTYNNIPISIIAGNENGIVVIEII